MSIPSSSVRVTVLVKILERRQMYTIFTSIYSHTFLQNTCIRIHIRSARRSVVRPYNVYFCSSHICIVHQGTYTISTVHTSTYTISTVHTSTYTISTVHTSTYTISTVHTSTYTISTVNTSTYTISTVNTSTYTISTVYPCMTVGTHM